MHQQPIDVSIDSVDPKDIPSGNFEGTWTGHIAKTQIGGVVYRFVMVNGVRGIDVPCRIAISHDGEISVEAAQ